MKHFQFILIAACGLASALGLQAQLARGVSGTQVFNTTSMGTPDTGEPNPWSTQAYGTEWYSILVSEPGFVRLDTVGSNFDTLLAVYYDSGAGESIYDGLVLVASNDNYGGNGKTTSQVEFYCSSPQVYSILVGRKTSVSGTLNLNYKLWDVDITHDASGVRYHFIGNTPSWSYVYFNNNYYYYYYGSDFHSPWLGAGSYRVAGSDTSGVTFSKTVTLP